MSDHPALKNNFLPSRSIIQNKERKMIEILIGAVAGGGIGYLIGKYMSRFQYGCPILCNPKISTIYFAVMGMLFANGR
jgi:hypothetical protein